MNKVPADTGSGKNSSRFAARLGAAIFCRLLLNTARRFVYPFAPALGRGLGVPLTSITSLIALNQFTGIFSPLFGPLGDRGGYRLMMLIGMGLLALGMLVGGMVPVYGMLLAALFLAGLGKTIFDPAVQAYIGERVPYRRRAMAIGLVETAWAGSTLIGIPLMGLLIVYAGWRAPFFVIGVLSVAGAVLMAMLIPPPVKHRDENNHSAGAHIWNSWVMLSRRRTALGIIAFSFFLSAANDSFFVIFGAWFEGAFGLSIIALGVSTMVIGGAELLGEGLTATLADRVGLERAVVTGVVLSIVSYAVLPLAGASLVWALGALFAVFLTVEFSIVTALSICTEVLPEARGTMMSGYIAAAGVGRFVGALIGGPVWLAGGMKATALVSLLLSVVSLFFLVWALRGWKCAAVPSPE